MARRRKPRTGNQGQPIRDIPGGTYGDRQALSQQQAAAPLQGPTPSPVGGGSAAVARSGGGNPAPVFGPSAFRPTERPNEPITSGIPFGPGHDGQNLVVPTDTVDSFLRALYSVFPDEAILRLLKE